MTRFLARRGVQLVTTLVGVFTLLFILIRATGDPVALLLGSGATTEQIANLRSQMGLDRSVFVQYLQALRDMALLDFGDSIRTNRDAMSMAFARLSVSVQLTGLALVFALVSAVPIGVWAAVKPRSWPARFAVGGTYVGQAIPVYVSGVFFILFLATNIGWLPTSGWSEPRHIILPVLTLGLVPMARFARITRASMSATLNTDHMKSTASRGLASWRVIGLHGMRNSMIGLVTLLGAEMGVLVGSAVITETLFAIPGLGRMLVTAALSRDYAVVQAGVFLVAVIVVVLNAVVDVAYGLLDPRLRQGLR